MNPPNFSLEKRGVRMAQIAATAYRLQREGIPVEKTLEGTGLIPADLEDTDALASYRERVRQFENVASLVEPGAWLDWRNEVSISDYGLLGYAMMSSATLDKAIQIAVKYHKMAGVVFELTFVADESDGVLRVENLLADGLAGQLVVDDLFAGITPLIRLLTGKPFEPTVIRFSFPRPEYAERYEQVFDCALEFDANYCEYRFDKQWLDQPLAEADANTAQICEASCRKLLDQMEIEEDIVSRVCQLLLSTPGDFPHLDAIALSLGIGSRTLRRRLAALGTNYQQLLDDVKKELAIEYLQTTDFSTQEISDLLGYSEVTNFRRAFVKWAGVSPFQYRKQLEAAEV